MSEEYVIAKKSTLTEIADKIREKKKRGGGADLFTLDKFAKKIGELGGAPTDLLEVLEVDDYIVGDVMGEQLVGTTDVVPYTEAEFIRTGTPVESSSTTDGSSTIFSVCYRLDNDNYFCAYKNAGSKSFYCEQYSNVSEVYTNGGGSSNKDTFLRFPVYFYSPAKYIIFYNKE